MTGLKNKRYYRPSTNEKFWDVRKFYCPFGICMNPECEAPRSRMVIDYIHPLALGGTQTIDNMQFLCQACSAAKANIMKDYRPDGGAFARSLLRR